MIGVDLAKQVFQLHGSRSDGSVAFRRKVRREQLLSVLKSYPRCLVVMEACGGAHYWGREIQALGHTVKLVPPAYVKPFVKRQKTDAADAEAICEAASRPTMRFVAVKSAEKQACGLAIKVRDGLVRQRTQTINMLRGHLTEYGLVVPQGTAHVGRLEALLAEAERSLPAEVPIICRMLLKRIADLDGDIAALESRIRQQAREDETARRLMTIPGIGPITAVSLAALAPPIEQFRRGRDFAAWIGLTPRELSSGGKQRLGPISRMGQRDLRRLLIIGATAVVHHVIRKRSAPAGSWLARMLERKPPMLVAVALANKMARIAWALMARGGTYGEPAAA